jgi:hypothetical protein
MTNPVFTRIFFLSPESEKGDSDDRNENDYIREKIEKVESERERQKRDEHTRRDLRDVDHRNVIRFVSPHKYDEEPDQTDNNGDTGQYPFRIYREKIERAGVRIQILAPVETEHVQD